MAGESLIGELEGPNDLLRPWRVLVAIIIGTMTIDEVALRTAVIVQRNWPTPEELAEANEHLEEVLRESGLVTQKSKHLREVSARYLVWLEDQLAGTTPIPPPAIVAMWPGFGRRHANRPARKPGKRLVLYTEWYERAR